MTDTFGKFEAIARTAKSHKEHEREDSPKAIHPFDERNIHPTLQTVSKKLFDDGHYSQSTFEAFKKVEKEVKTASGISDSGFSLMMNAFNEKGPKIALNALADDSDRDEQLGYRHMFAGSMAAIRNPRGHEIKSDPIDLCLDHLSIASALLRALDGRVP